MSTYRNVLFLTAMFTAAFVFSGPIQAAPMVSADLVTGRAVHTDILSVRYRGHRGYGHGGMRAFHVFGRYEPDRGLGFGDHGYGYGHQHFFGHHSRDYRGFRSHYRFGKEFHRRR